MKKDVLLINGCRDGYTVCQCDCKTTVGELIEALQDYDSNMEIYLCNDGGYTYGSIDLSTLREKTVDLD